MAHRIVLGDVLGPSTVVGNMAFRGGVLPDKIRDRRRGSPFRLFLYYSSTNCDFGRTPRLLYGSGGLS